MGPCDPALGFLSLWGLRLRRTPFPGGTRGAAGRGGAARGESGFRLVLLLLLFPLFYPLCPEVKLFSVLFPQCLPVSVERGLCPSHGTVASDTAALAVQHVPIVTIYYMFG